MNWLKKTVVPVIVATIWITISEFLRNQVLLKYFWTGHYGRIGLIFPSEPVNVALWVLWSLLFAIAIFIMLKKFTVIQTALLSWFTGFVMMWVVTYNLGVLPTGIFYLAVPLSLLEALIAAVIIRKMGK